MTITLAALLPDPCTVWPTTLEILPIKSGVTEFPFTRLNSLPLFATIYPELNWKNFCVSQATRSGQL